MTVKELKEKLNEYPDSMDVFLDERLTEFTFGLLNGIREQEILFYEFGEDGSFCENGAFPKDDAKNAKDEVVILSED